MAKQDKRAKKVKKIKEKRKRKWYNAKRNSSVYVQGLPPDVSAEELRRFFSRAGVLRFDVETGEERIKVYRDKASGLPKGDALVSFANQESVELAVSMLSGKELRPGCELSVEPAQFEQKGDYQPRREKVIDELAKIKWRANMERVAGWGDPDDQAEGLRIVILRGMFEPADFDEAGREAFFATLEEDIRLDFEEKFGPIKRITVCENHPDGVVQVKFERAGDAERCMHAVHNRFYNGHQIECFYWDGKTNYKIAPETAEQQQQRIDEFGKWLTGQIDSEKLFKNLQ